nr:MAG TPA: major capsid protein [Bacteriophage sp.]
MKVEQIYTLCNQISGEVLGKTDILQADLTNVVDFGNEVIGTGNMDNYVKSLIDHIGKVAFVDRPYSGSAPSVLMDGWEFGSILEKITMTKLPEATENSSWKLENGKSYDTGVFTAPEVSAKFYNSLATYEIPMSFAEKQVKSSFSSAQQMNAFFSMIQNAIETSMTVKTDGLIMDTICSMIAETLVDYNSEGTYTGIGNNRAINLLALYNARFTQTLTAEKCLTDPQFIRWASFMIGLYSGRMTKLSTLFNIGGTEKFTSKDRLHLVMLDEFAKASDVYLQSDTFHEQYTALPNAETVPFWQGSGTSYEFATTSHINIKHGTHTVDTDGILAVMFDREALGVSNLDKRVTSQYNARGEFYNNWYKFDAGYFNDLNENFVVFYVA